MLTEKEIFVLAIISSVFFVSGLLFFTTNDMARRDALDSMCKTYGGATGNAIDVFQMSVDNQTGYYVKCENIIGDSVKDKFRYIILNGSNVVY